MSLSRWDTEQLAALPPGDRETFNTFRLGHPFLLLENFIAHLLGGTMDKLSADLNNDPTLSDSRTADYKLGKGTGSNAGKH